LIRDNFFFLSSSIEFEKNGSIKLDLQQKTGQIVE